MNSKPLTRFGVFLALSASCLVFVLVSLLVRSALGEPEPERRTSSGEGRASRQTDVSAAKPTFDPRLLIKLQQAEATRRTARKQAIQDPKGWEEGRPQRASVHRAQLAALWGSVSGSIDGQAHLRMHADHMARLNRMLDLAELQSDSALLARIHLDISRELARHMQAMRQLQAAAGLP